jgi:hypothetical protein
LPIDNIARVQYNQNMAWTVVYLDNYTKWFEEQEEGLQDDIIAYLDLLEELGPTLGRPYADTLSGSSLTNLKELRLTEGRSEIRILFVFDPKQQAVLILGGDKTGDKRWYKTNIPIAESLYSMHLENQKKEDDEAKRKEQDKKKRKG